MTVSIRPYASADRDDVNRIGLHTSPVMLHALALYSRIGFAHDADLPPISGMPYARCSGRRAAVK